MLSEISYDFEALLHKWLFENRWKARPNFFFIFGIRLTINFGLTFDLKKRFWKYLECEKERKNCHVNILLHMQTLKISLSFIMENCNYDLCYVIWGFLRICKYMYNSYVLYRKCNTTPPPPQKKRRKDQPYFPRASYANTSFFQGGLNAS